MLLNVSQVTKKFAGNDGPIPVLDAVSFSVAAGEVVALTGESGSGKSTLLHIVGGLEPVDSGAVEVNGEDMTQLPDVRLAQLRREDIGIIFQQFNLIPSLTVRRNLSFQAELAGRSADCERLAETLGIADQLEKYPEDLSGGQQQRVAIGRALAAKPGLILADEPTGNLDEATSTLVFNLLIEQARTLDAGLLIATHSERLAALADRRLALNAGQISQ